MTLAALLSFSYFTRFWFVRKDTHPDTIYLVIFVGSMFLLYHFWNT